MARIPEAEIERLKKEVPVERLVMGFGIELKRHGAELVGRCPFHDDKTPSLVVSPKTNLWHCLGACNVGGSTIDWVMKTQGVSFRHAVELLRADHPALAAGDGHVVRKGSTVKLESPVAADADDRQALVSVAAFYHSTLKEAPEALRLPTAVLHPGFGVVNSFTALGLRAFEYDFRVGPFFTGKERDGESGLDYFGARYFSGAMGRWTSPDWSATPQPIPYANLSDPQTLNLYSYVRNNPLSKSDLDGHGCPPICVGETAIAGYYIEQALKNDYVAGSLKVSVGVGLIATAAFGDVPGAGVGTALLTANAGITGAATMVSGTTQIIGKGTGHDTSTARDAVEAVGTVPGLVVAAATGGSTSGRRQWPQPSPM